MENPIVHRDSRSRESVRYTPPRRALWSTNAVATLRAMLESCFQSFLTKSNVGRSPWTAVDALVGLRLTGLARPDLGVRRGRGRPPHIHRRTLLLRSVLSSAAPGRSDRVPLHVA